MVGFWVGFGVVSFFGGGGWVVVCLGGLRLLVLPFYCRSLGSVGVLVMFGFIGFVGCLTVGSPRQVALAGDDLDGRWRGKNILYEKTPFPCILWALQVGPTCLKYWG